MRRLLIAVVLAVAALPGSAERTPATLELGAKLADLLRVRLMVEALLKQCSDPEGSSFDAKTAFTSSPASFGGISPQSAYWPEIEAIYAEYRSGTCAYLTADNFVAYYGWVLADKNTEEDLRAALLFYSSPAGNRFQDSVVFASVAFQEFARESMRKATIDANEKYQAAVRAVIRQYKREPR